MSIHTCLLQSDRNATFKGYSLTLHFSVESFNSLEFGKRHPMTNTFMKQKSRSNQKRKEKLLKNILKGSYKGRKDMLLQKEKSGRKRKGDVE